METTRKAKSLRRHKLGIKWNEMSITDRNNFLQKSSVGHSGWALESWWGLPDCIRKSFVDHCEITEAIYAYR